MCQERGFESEAIPRIASGFGGGIGNTGSVCGAVIGAVMALGLMREHGDTLKERLETLAVAQEFRQRFEAEQGNIICREMTGADLTTEEGIEQFMCSDTPEKVCFPAVGTAYRIVLDMLEESK